MNEIIDRKGLSLDLCAVERAIEAGTEKEMERELLDALEHMDQSRHDTVFDIAQTFCTLAYLYRRQGRYEESEQIYQRALDRFAEEEEPELHVWLLAEAAGLACEQGQFQKAVQYRTRVLDKLVSLLGENSQEVAEASSDLAAIYLVLKDYDRAGELYSDALKIRETTLGEKHLDVASSYAALALLHYLAGSYEQAEHKVKSAIDIRTDLLGENNVTTGSFLNLLGLSLCGQGKHDEARPNCQRAITIREDNRHSDSASYLSELANVFCSQGRFDEAKPLCMEALRQREKVLGCEHPSLADNLATYAFILQGTNKADEAELILNRLSVIDS